ncbi:MAG: cysteine desulfurase NifS [Candidatus Diapherotrites archaeon]
MKRIYMDHAATSPVDAEVLEAMKPFFSEKFGNSSSLHSFGKEAKGGLDWARGKVAEAINAKPKEIIFTSGGTESDNLALKGIAYAYREKGNHIITTKIEHHAVLHTCEFLEKHGFDVTYLGVDKHGFIDLDELNNAITEKTILVSVMHANNEIGTIEPVEEIGKICRGKGVKFHTDAVQTAGKVPIDVEKMNIDALSISGHKIYGPKGVGALYLRSGTMLEPQILGGGHEFGKRSGTENIAGIVGLGKAMELAVKRMDKEAVRLALLQDKLSDKIQERIDGVKLNGHPEKRLPGNANFSFDFIEGEGLITHLDLEGIAASTGSACSTKSLEPSHVLTAIGLSHVQAHGSLRISLGKGNTEEDIDYLVEVLPPIIEKLREMSPLNKDNVKEFENFDDGKHEHSHKQ